MHKLLYAHTQQPAPLLFVLKQYGSLLTVCASIRIRMIRRQPLMQRQSILRSKGCSRTCLLGLRQGHPLLSTQCYTSSSAAVPARISFCDLVPAFSTSAAAVVAADGQTDSSQLS